MSGWLTAAKAAGQVGASFAFNKLTQPTSTRKARNFQGQRVTQGTYGHQPRQGIDNSGTSWWNAEASGTMASRQDWRNVGPLAVAKGTGSWTLPGRATVAQGLKGVKNLAQSAAAPGGKPMGSYAGTADRGGYPDMGRRFHFLNGVQTLAQASGEIGGMLGIGPGPHPTSDMRFGEGRPFGLPSPGHKLTNVRQGDDGWFPGMPDEHLGRSSSFELGRGMLALGPGPTIEATASERPDRRKAGMSEVKLGEIHHELADAAGKLNEPLVQPTKQRRKAGASEAAIKRAREDWPKMPGQPTLGI